MPEIRRMTGDEILSQYAPLHRYAFYATPPLELSEYEKQLNLYRDAINLALFEGDQALATVISIPMTQNIRGKIFKMGGVLGVTSDPLTRRKGYVRQLMIESHKLLFEDGYPVVTLYPFRESFYERMGYTLFVHHRRLKFKTADMKPLLDLDLSGSVEYVLLQDAWQVYEEAIHEQQKQLHGMGLFLPEPLKELHGKADRWLAIARDENGAIIGVMPYKITGFWGTFEIQTLFLKNSHGRYLLLQWIARHIDQVTDVDILKLSPTERPETWFSDLKVEGNPDIWLTAMGRVINVRLLEGMPVGEGRLTLEIEDQQCAWNRGTFTFEGCDGLLTVKDGGEAECKITIQALSALIYGSHDPHDFQWRGWGDPSPETIAKMQRLFPLMQPYLFVVF